jgi:hypothetical protein
MASLLNGSGTQYEIRAEKQHPGNPLKKLSPARRESRDSWKKPTVK